ncbi:TPA: hypothetical protein ACGIK9_002798 [Acinetobacter baumannii]|uniref:hypothetical protein n=1 Tax=Acinetobacter baumannii TaxID=470 RepID=UPI00338DB122
MPNVHQTIIQIVEITGCVIVLISIFLLFRSLLQSRKRAIKDIELKHGKTSINSTTTAQSFSKASSTNDTSQISGLLLISESSQINESVNRNESEVKCNGSNDYSTSTSDCSTSDGGSCDGGGGCD